MYYDSLEQLSLSQILICSLIEGMLQSTVSRYLANSNFESLPNSVSSRKKYSFNTSREIIRDLHSKNLKPKAKVQVFYNFKGGTGKTSLCHQLSVMFALYGYKVLAIDCDPQAHLSFSLGFDQVQDVNTLYDVIINNVPIEQSIVEIYPGLDVIPSNLSLTRIEPHLNQMANREKVLSKKLELISHKYDFIFIDTNPTISTLNRNAMLASNMLNIVCETQPYSLKGLEILVEEIEQFGRAMEQEINYQIIPNKYESKTAISQESLGMLHTKYKGKVMEVVVRRCEDMNLSAKKRMPLFGVCGRKSIALEDIIDLSKAMLEKSTVKVTGDLFDAVA